MLDSFFLQELVDCAKTELGIDVVIGKPDSSLSFESLFGYSFYGVEASTEVEDT